MALLIVDLKTLKCHFKINQPSFLQHFIYRILSHFNPVIMADSFAENLMPQPRMTQPRPSKMSTPWIVIETLSLNKARIVLILEYSYTLKCVLLIKVCITPYKPNISPVLCQCVICLGFYITLSRDLASSPNFAPPSLKTTRGATLILSVMTQLKPDNILSTLG